MNIEESLCVGFLENKAQVRAMSSVSTNTPFQLHFNQSSYVLEFL